jgi:hypothetical protein
LAIATLMLLLGATACGSDGDSDSADDPTTTVGDEGRTTDDGGDDGSDDGGDDGGTGGDGDLAAAIEGMGGCSGAAAAVSATIGAAFSGQGAEGFEENQELLDRLATSVPDDLQDAVDLYTSYMAAYSEALGDFDPSDFANPETAEEIGDAFDQLEEDYPSDEMQAASEEISAWFTDECPALER